MKHRLVTYFPYLFSVTPVLSLYITNADYIPVHFVIGPVIFVVLMTYGLSKITHLVFKDKHRSSAILSVFLIVFFAFGEISNLVRGLILRFRPDQTGYNFLDTKNGGLVVLLFLLFIVLLFAYMVFQPGKLHDAAMTVLTFLAFGSAVSIVILWVSAQVYGTGGEIKKSLGFAKDWRATFLRE